MTRYLSVLLSVLAISLIANAPAVYAADQAELTKKQTKRLIRKITKKKINAILPIETPNLATEAVTTNKIMTGAVTTSEIADGAVTSAKLSSSVVPQSDLLYASVSGGSIVEANSRGATNATNTGVGQYTVTFERDVSGCAWFPSRSAIGTAIPANGDFLGVGGLVGDPNSVRVRVRDNNNIFANRSFSLLVVC